MSKSSRLVPLAICRRYRKQLAFTCLTLVFLCTFTMIQYTMTVVLVEQRQRLRASSSDVTSVTSSESLVRGQRSLPTVLWKRPLGVSMPSVDYSTFKQLERQNARSTDPDVLRLARQAMLDPPLSRGKMKIRFIRKTGQAQAVEEILRNKTDGFFVECGAFDGETASNTVYLEHFRKWTGLLVEMDPYFYTQLVGKRRRAWSINACISNNNRLVEMKFFESDGQLGRLDSKSSNQINQLDAETHNGNNMNVLPNSALCFPFESLLLALNRTHIDYFSLDVEGFELDILRSIPFDQLDIDVVSAEFLHSKEPQSAYDDLFERYGYKRYKQIGDMDLIFAKKHLLEGLPTVESSPKAKKQRPGKRPQAKPAPRKQGRRVDVLREKSPKNDDNFENNAANEANAVVADDDSVNRRVAAADNQERNIDIDAVAEEHVEKPVMKPRDTKKNSFIIYDN